jgi:hypothetical protein
MGASPPRGPWESVAFISPARMTACTHLSLPGTIAGNTPNASISTINPTYKNMLVTCEQTGGTFIKDVTYKRNSDNTNWITISGGKHLHDLDTDPAGGLISDILMANQLKLFNLNDNMNANVNNFFKEGTATAANEIDTALGNRIKIDTGASTGTYGHLSRGGVKLSFASPSQFQFKGNVAYPTSGGDGNVTAYIGVGLASVNDTTNQLQYGIQVCDSSGTDRNWEMVNGNGSSKGVSTSPTEPVKQTAGPRSYKLHYTPGQNTRFWVNNSLQGTNTSAVVASGSTTGIRNISIGIRTNTSISRQLYCYGVSLIGVASDTLWV